MGRRWPADIPRPYRRAGQDPRLPDRAGRDRDRPGRPPRRAGRGGHRVRRGQQPAASRLPRPRDRRPADPARRGAARSPSPDPARLHDPGQLHRAARPAADTRTARSTALPSRSRPSPFPPLPARLRPPRPRSFWPACGRNCSAWTRSGPPTTSSTSAATRSPPPRPSPASARSSAPRSHSRNCSTTPRCGNWPKRSRVRPSG
jgi:hypothetical protein